MHTLFSNAARQMKQAVSAIRSFAALRGALLISLILVVTTPVHAQSSPWENAVQVLQTAFTSTIAKGLSLVAIVVGGLMFAFGEGQSKRQLAGILFGVGMAISAVNFMSWLFAN
jgi:type IV secretory pathway VirB2 component (pilin)